MAPALDVLPHRHVLTLPNEPSAVRLARETAERALVEWGIGLHRSVVDAALLILSELVTNSVRHAAECSPQIVVTYAASGSRLAFAVHDRHPHQPPLHQAMTGTGGGLGTVMELTRQLGGTAAVQGDADGKNIWITLPL
ncbi:ATP-binding protein [Streptomyces luteolifulvus]|uniref:ATP-binding protein n=1 Tax=Streptomyces luteolifulvus TaxID=2615112 RepID=A0A6H9V7Q3_9ACTN|nr:ATP-binding protein [Streptomyces luteolifulvus]KAB1150161.1 ATP-binding protein [Streptomyces luteolifulvus]